MRNKLAMMAALAGALAAPSIGGAVEVQHRRSPMEDWLRDNGKMRGKGRSVTRDPSRLQLKGWPEIPCDAPDGYFWHRAPEGRRLYYLLKTAPGRRSVEYDETNDRSIISSGFGYVKPTYAHGDRR